MENALITGSQIFLRCYHECNPYHKRDKVFKNGPSKICAFKRFEGIWSFEEINSLAPFLITWNQM